MCGYKRKGALLSSIETPKTGSRAGWLKPYRAKPSRSRRATLLEQNFNFSSRHIKIQNVASVLRTRAGVYVSVPANKFLPPLSFYHRNFSTTRIRITLTAPSERSFLTVSANSSILYIFSWQCSIGISFLTLDLRFSILYLKILNMQILFFKYYIYCYVFNDIIVYLFLRKSVNFFFHA